MKLSSPDQYSPDKVAVKAFKKKTTTQGLPDEKALLIVFLMKVLHYFLHTLYTSEDF